MPFTHEAVPEKQYVRLVMSGSMTRDDYERSSVQLSSVLEENGRKRLLVDTRQRTSELSTTGDYDFTKQLPSRFPPGTRLAILFAPDKVQNLNFVQTVARNRGLSLMLFDDDVEAVGWLLER